MRRKIKVRGRDGAIREVNDGYVLRDGKHEWSNCRSWMRSVEPLSTMDRVIPQGKDLAFCTATQMNRENRPASMPMRSMMKPFENVGDSDPTNKQTQRNPNHRRSTVRKLPSLPPMRNTRGHIQERWRK